MKYFTARCYGTNAKNKAQRECSELYKNPNYDNMLINDSQQRDSLIDDLIQKVNDINKENPRCADVQIIRTGYTSDSTGFSVGGLFYLRVYKVKKEI